MEKNSTTRTRSWLRGKAKLGAMAAATAAAGLSVFGLTGVAQAAPAPHTVSIPGLIAAREALLSGGSSAGASGVSPAVSTATSTPEWHVAYRGQAAGLYSVVSVSKTNAWAVGVIRQFTTGQRPEFMHWDGHAWGVYNVPGISNFAGFSIKGTAGNDVWAFGYNAYSGTSYSDPIAVLYHGSNVTSTMTLPTNWVAGNELLFASNDLWGTSYQNCSTTPDTTLVPCTHLEHWTGSGWAAPITVAGFVSAASAANGHAYFLSLKNERFATSGNGQYGFGAPVVYEIPDTTTGRGLTTQVGPNLQVDALGSGVVATPSGKRYIEATYTTGNAAHFWSTPGAGWSTISVPSGLHTIAFFIAPDGGNGFWNDWGAHWTGSAWINTNHLASSFYNSYIDFMDVAAIPGTPDVWTVGAIAPSSSSTPWVNAMVGYYNALP